MFYIMIYILWFIFCFSDVGGYRIVGCPKSIEDNRYARNALIFNFVFVFEEETTTTTYEPVIQKLGNAFRTYEVNRQYLLKVHFILIHFFLYKVCLVHFINIETKVRIFHLL